MTPAMWKATDEARTAIVASGKESETWLAADANDLYRLRWQIHAWRVVFACAMAATAYATLIVASDLWWLTVLVWIGALAGGWFAQHQMDTTQRVLDGRLACYPTPAQLIAPPDEPEDETSDALGWTYRSDYRRH